MGQGVAIQDTLLASRKVIVWSLNSTEKIIRDVYERFGQPIVRSAEMASMYQMTF